MMVIDHSQDWFFLDWWPLLFNLEWWCHVLVWGAIEGTDRI
jgi:hypothetical protein